MPTRNINLTPQMDQFVDGKIRSGEYGNASEVMRAALRALEQAEREDEARLEGLRTALVAGEKSGIALGGVFAEARQRVGDRAAAKKRA